MNSETPMDRDAELRRMLVTTVSATPLLRSHARPKVIVGAIAAFAVAGALTGGAVASASSQSQSNVITLLGAGAKSFAHDQNAKTVGLPYSRESNTTGTVEVGDPPKGANGLVMSFECLDPGKYVVRVDGRLDTSATCSTSVNIGAPTTSLIQKGRTYTVESPDHGRYAIWISWVKREKFTPSYNQQAAMADGVVTREEYIDAYNRFAGCLGAFGDDVGVTPRGTILQYATSGNEADENRCYIREFQQVDSAWQGQHQ
ncbi:MAG: hypothetical protein QOE85_1636 [Actinomycetota bacterium]|nr:hypothetical protein [Actinomycetota bacterium]